MTCSMSFPRESKELISVSPTVNGAPVTAFDVTLTTQSERPLDWDPATVIGDDRGYLLPGTLEPDLYTLWARITSLPEVVVIRVQTITIT